MQLLAGEEGDEGRREIDPTAKNDTDTNVAAIMDIPLSLILADSNEDRNNALILKGGKDVLSGTI